MDKDKSLKITIQEKEGEFNIFFFGRFLKFVLNVLE